MRPLYHWRTSRPHEYTHSALNAIGDDDARCDDGPGHGAPPRNVRLGPDEHLLDHLGGGFDLLLCTPGQAVADDVLKEVQAQRLRGVPLRVVAVGASAPVAGADLSLADPDGALRARWGLQTHGNAYLLRPDQHVCARWLTLDATRLRAALDAALPR